VSAGARVIVVGADVLAAYTAEKERAVPKVAGGYFESEALWKFAERTAGQFVEAELVKSIYGYSVRYASGVHNFGLLASSRMGVVDGTLEDAERWAREWQGEDPQRRYVTRWAS
jgi:hypothetical protein